MCRHRQLEAEALKILAKRLSLVGELEGFAITDSEGIDSLRSTLLSALLALIGRHPLSSDIDVLIVTDKPPGEVLAKLWEKGVKDPFEIHVVTKEMLGLYKKRAKLVKII